MELLSLRCGAFCNFMIVTPDMYTRLYVKYLFIHFQTPLNKVGRVVSMVCSLGFFFERSNFLQGCEGFYPSIDLYNYLIRSFFVCISSVYLDSLPSLLCLCWLWGYVLCQLFDTCWRSETKSGTNYFGLSEGKCGIYWGHHRATLLR